MTEEDYKFGLLTGFLIAKDAPAEIREALEGIRAAKLNSSEIQFGGKPQIFNKGVLEFMPSQVETRVQEALSIPEPPEVYEQRIEPESDTASPGNPEPKEDTARSWPQWKKDRLMEWKDAKRPTSGIAPELGKSVAQCDSMYCYLRKKREAQQSAQKKTASSADDGKPRRPERSWGNRGGKFTPTTPAGTTTTYIDESGRTITKYPPGFAIGIKPGVTAKGISGDT